MTVTTPAHLARAYGAAMRGDWSEVDGRSVRDDMNRLAYLIDTYGNGAIGLDEVANERVNLGLCVFGEGHWEQHCEWKHPHTEPGA